MYNGHRWIAHLMYMFGEWITHFNLHPMECELITQPTTANGYWMNKNYQYPMNSEWWWINYTTPPTRTSNRWWLCKQLNLHPVNSRLIQTPWHVQWMKDGLHRPQITFDRHIQLMTIQVDLYLRDSKWTAYHNPHLLDTK